MSQQYASNQPAGFRNRIEKVAIVGAGGNVGKFITSALLKTGQHTITAITRADSKSTLPDGVTVAKVDYADTAALVDALKGHDALIITLTAMAPPDTETTLIDAAHAAGVPWVMPNTYSSDPDQKELQRDIIIGVGKQKICAYAESKPGMSWLGLTCNFWYEHSLCFKWGYGFDLDKKEITFFDDGTVKINTSTWPQCGLAVAKVLSLPVLPADEADKSLTLDQFRNKSVYVSSFLLSQKGMFASILRVTGSKEADWKIEYEDSKTRFEDGQRELAAGNRRAFGKLLYTRMFFPDGCGNYESKLHNRVLGLPEEDLDEYTQKAIELNESGYGSWAK